MMRNSAKNRTQPERAISGRLSGAWNLDSRDHVISLSVPSLVILDGIDAIGDLLDATLAIEPNRPVRVKRNFTVFEGGKQ
ncbi:hypothetical protein V1290_002507 [Bradyrhizobium sp. AZCC 1578]|uniref:hypothetical protein n=1 Tax=Bradyrhizobium sp. AZCC 1578 TaxID=3117027 RepID=UPI002FF31627